VTTATRHRIADILLVEDNPGDARLFKEALAMHSADANLRVVEDGEDAMRLLRGEEPFAAVHRPDLVVLDLNLPKKDGREVLAEMKGDPNLRRIPVIILTTSDADSDVNRAYDLHANCYIRKPADFDHFMMAIGACETFWLNVVRLPNA
jgi:two-component system, chemotaxis family, response regulator Rcp1